MLKSSCMRLQRALFFKRHGARVWSIEVATVSVDSEDEVFYATARSGYSLQLPCDVHSARQLVWTRLGVSLHDIQQFEVRSKSRSPARHLSNIILLTTE